MNRKDLQGKYNILGNNNDISLYRKKGEYTYGCGYCGNVKLNNGTVSFNKHRYSDIASLDKALREWEASLPWPVDTYNPLMRGSACLQDRIVWYLTEKLGFKQTISNWNIRYVRNVGPDCQISFMVERPKSLDEDKVTIISQHGGLMFRNKVETADDGVAVISSIIRQSALQMSSDMVDILSIVPDTEVPDIQAYVKSNKNIFGFEQVDFKGMMISLLENELKKLKGE